LQDGEACELCPIGTFWGGPSTLVDRDSTFFKGGSYDNSNSHDDAGYGADADAGDAYNAYNANNGKHSARGHIAAVDADGEDGAAAGRRHHRHNKTRTGHGKHKRGGASIMTAAACLSCSDINPGGSFTTLAQGSKSVSDCACSPGYGGETCALCPAVRGRLV
jgi:hypothetical protein